QAASTFRHLPRKISSTIFYCRVKSPSFPSMNASGALRSNVSSDTARAGILRTSILATASPMPAQRLTAPHCCSKATISHKLTSRRAEPKNFCPQAARRMHNREDMSPATLPIGPLVDVRPAKQPERVTLKGRWVTLAPLDARAHAEALY